MVSMNRQKYDLCAAVRHAQQSGRLQSVQNRQSDIGNQNIRVQAQNSFDGITPVPETADDMKILAQFQADLFEYRIVIVGDDNSNLVQ